MESTECPGPSLNNNRRKYGPTTTRQSSRAVRLQPVQFTQLEGAQVIPARSQKIYILMLRPSEYTEGGVRLVQSTLYRLVWTQWAAPINDWRFFFCLVFLLRSLTSEPTVMYQDALSQPNNPLQLADKTTPLFFGYGDYEQFKESFKVWDAMTSVFLEKWGNTVIRKLTKQAQIRENRYLHQHHGLKLALQK